MQVEADAADPSGLTVLTGRLAAVLGHADLTGAWSVSLQLSVPGGPGLAPVRLVRAVRPGLPPATKPPAVDTVVAAAEGMRRLPSAGLVLLSASEVSVDLSVVAARSGAPLTSAVAELRSLPGFGTGALAAATVAWHRDGARDGDARSVEVSSSAPSAGLVALIDRLTVRTDVTWLMAREGRDATRPSLSVSSGRPEWDALALAAVTDADADAGRRPRTAFTATRAGDLDREFTGYVGLPLASATPALTWQKLRPAAPAPASGPEPESPAPTGPVEAGQQVAAARGAVEAFLRASVTAASVAGTAPEPRIDVADCATGARTSVEGDVLLPVWQAPDATEESVEAAFDRITGSWAAVGLHRSDRAMGTDYWTPSPSAAAAATLSWASIRGTTEGLRVRAASACTG